MGDRFADRFEDFFRALWGYRPFAWQRALAQRVLSNAEAPWPQAIALPTAAGKTACIDIAVFALAAQADRIGTGEPITAARRIFFVVDRRIIVDEAFQRARQLARALDQPSAPILVEAASRLRLFASGLTPTDGPSRHPLEAFELRGGIYRSEAWAKSPLQPAVIASTVDQFGSRLMFRAYGRGPGMWPVFAALTGNDALILLDEAHCAQPFLETLRAVARYRTWADRPLTNPFHPVVLSATPPEETADDTFRDTSDEPSDPDHLLGRRQLARKPTRLVESKASGKKLHATLAKGLARHARELAQGPRKAVVVFSNRVATARETHRLLSVHCRKHGGHALLVTGRMRPVDRDWLIENEHFAPLFSKRAEGRNLDDPVYVVATQTLEVGADLDFDALVTECASLDALRQRFGRLNRLGRAIGGTDDQRRPIGAEAVIVSHAEQTRPNADDPIYGAAIGHTWRALVETAGDAGLVDFAIADLDADTLEAQAQATLTPPPTHAPVLLPSHLDALVQTSPMPEPSPDPALFLRGPARGAPDISVCWRGDISLDSSTAIERALETLTICPPAASECLRVPIGAMRRWLAGEHLDDSTDIEGTAEPDSDGRRPDANPSLTALRWIGRDSQPRTATPVDLRPGDVVVLPCSGDVPGTLGDFPQGVPPTNALDRGDEAHLRARAKALVRLHPALLDAWPIDDATRSAFNNLLKQASERLDEEPEDLIAELVPLLERLAEALDGNRDWVWLGDSAAHFVALGKRRLRRLLLRHPDTGLVLRGTKPLPEYTSAAETFTDEDDATASGTGRAVPLFGPPDASADTPAGHLSGVARFARSFAGGCGLAPDLVDAVERAGLLHDLGKADPRFQALLHGGNPWASGPLLAKSAELPQGAAAFEAARVAAGYPKGGRHELLSVRLAESGDKGLLTADDDLKRLILHLIASHHGRCRPFAPVVVDPSPPGATLTLNGATLNHEGPTGLERLESGVCERFWNQVRCYGWWGSAWLEAILRLADHRRSEAEERQ